VDSGLGNSATVGIRSAGGLASGKQIQWSYNAGVLSNNYAILLTPPAGRQQSVNLITSVPSGLTVTIDGTPYTTPHTISWVPNSAHNLSAASQTIHGMQESFASWSPGGANGTIPVVAQNPGTTYTANFTTQYQLTSGSNPSGGGTVSGAGFYAPNAVASVQATPAAGYSFVNFSGDINSTSNPVNVTMNSPKNVVANFRSSANPTLAATIGAKANGTGTQRIWTVTLTDRGAGAANSAQITGLTLTQTAGTPCSPAPSLVSALPVGAGAIQPSGTGSGQVTLEFGGCTGNPLFTVLVQFSANSGGYSGSTTIFNQTK
jgi:Divergent InlB B-repeat domain